MSELYSLTNFPRLISMETLSTCNARCAFCPHRLTTRNTNISRIPEYIFEKVINECAQYEEFENLTLSFQNEPFLDNDIFDYIENAKKAGKNKYKTCLVTNGSLLSKEKIARLIKEPVDILKISVYGICKEAYEKNMVGLDFEKTMKNIDNILYANKDGKIEVIINVVHTDDIEQQGFHNILDYWSNKGAKTIFINEENRAGFLKHNTSSQNWRRRDWCQRPLKQLSVLTTGEVVLCCAVWNREAIVGNLAHESLYSIWHSSKMKYYRDMLSSGKIDILEPCCDCKQADMIMDGEKIIEYRRLGVTK